MDEELRRLRREAHATGDPGKILAYVDAALRTVGVEVPPPAASANSDRPTAETLTLTAMNGYPSVGRSGEAILMFDPYTRRVAISVDGRAFAPIRMGDDPRNTQVALPRFDPESTDKLTRAVNQICSILCQLGYAWRES